MRSVSNKLHVGKRPGKSTSGRDHAYDKGRAPGKAQSVYSPQCIIQITRSYGLCANCGKEHDLINNYCAVCRANCANEAQCMNPRRLTGASQ